MTATEHVILVDENDKPIGTAEKLMAHQNNLMHRAFSVFIYKKQPKIQLLLQQRASGKYHSANLWTNTCCSHPRPGEEIVMAGKRRLKEEMGIEAELKSAGSFHYIAHFDNGLVENEVDHVLVGIDNGKTFHPDPKEAQNFKWVSIEDLQSELVHTPEKFTPWLKPALALVLAYFKAEDILD
jgi:isopentenyl-diphosphate delta-isomerase type 1